MINTTRTRFDPSGYLVAAGVNRRTLEVDPSHLFFSQGDGANSIFFLEAGRAKLIVVSRGGKEATISLLGAGDFIGEESLAGVTGLRSTTAVAITHCTALKFDREEMLRLLHEKHEFSDLFLRFILLRAGRTQEDLVDQLFNNSEKRLARILLLMAEMGQHGETDGLIPPVTQEALADIIGTTRSRVSKFMNRFRRLGYIQYNGRIHVHKALQNVVLHEHLLENTAKHPTVVIDPKGMPITTLGVA
jgi:CRP/FNR family cyclic AMP-dependent transcriptional regulator